MRWLFPGQEIAVVCQCLDCGEAIHVHMRDEEILKVDPETAVGYAPHVGSPFATSRAGSGAFN